MKKLAFVLPLAAIIAACGSGTGGGSESAGIKIVGSSTVYPFTTAVAEQFQRSHPGINVVVESTGTGSGIKLFCSGVGADTPGVPAPWGGALPLLSFPFAPGTLPAAYSNPAK